MSAKPPTGWLGREDFGPVTVVRLKAPGAVDDDATRAVFDPLDGLVGGEGRTGLVLDLAAVDHLPSLALGKLITLNKKLQQAGGRLVLCNIDPQIYEVFEITKLNKLFTIVKDEQSGLQAF